MLNQHLKCWDPTLANIAASISNVESTLAMLDPNISNVDPTLKMLTFSEFLSGQILRPRQHSQHWFNVENVEVTP